LDIEQLTVLVTIRFVSGKLLAKEQIDLTVIKAAELTGRVLAGIGQ